MVLLPVSGKTTQAQDRFAAAAVCLPELHIVKCARGAWRMPFFAQKEILIRNLGGLLPQCHDIVARLGFSALTGRALHDLQAILSRGCTPARNAPAAQARTPGPDGYRSTGLLTYAPRGMFPAVFMPPGGALWRTRRQSVTRLYRNPL